VRLYTELPIDDTWMLVLGFPLGFFASGIFSGMGAFLTENFPTRMHGSGQGFAYNFGRGIGALNPTFVGLLSTTLSEGLSEPSSRKAHETFPSRSRPTPTRPTNPTFAK
jgi:MFS family permease